MRIAILGAGISGLSCAWYLKERYGSSVHITLIEKSDRVGGLIRTVNQDGFLFELGPRGFRPYGKGKETLELACAVGLERELVAANPDAKKRYILSHGELKQVTFPFLLKKGLIFAMTKDILSTRTSKKDETLLEFSHRHFGRKMTREIIDPFITGIFGGSISLLSARSCFPSFWQSDQKYGSLMIGLLSKRKEKHHTPLLSFKNGMETLPKQIANRLSADILLNSPVLKMKRQHKYWNLHLPTGEIESDLVISTLPYAGLNQIMPLPFQLPHVTITTVNLGYENIQLPQKGFGFLVSGQERLLGMTWDSDIFPDHNQGQQVRICMMVKDIVDSTTAIALAKEHIQKFLGIKRTPSTVHINTAFQAIPQYPLNYHESIVKIHHPNLWLAGTAFSGIGVNDCIANSKKLQNQLRPYISEF